MLSATAIMGPGWVTIRRIKGFHRDVVRLCDPDGRISLPSW